MAKKKPRRRAKALTETNVLAAVTKYRGNFAAVAKSLGVTRQAVSKYVLAHPSLQEAVTDQRESRLDRAESAIDKAIDRGEAWAISLTLKALGKERGWVERQELTGKNGAPVVAPVDLSKLSDDELGNLEAILDRATNPNAPASPSGAVPPDAS